MESPSRGFAVSPLRSVGLICVALGGTRGWAGGVISTGVDSSASARCTVPVGRSSSMRSRAAIPMRLQRVAKAIFSAAGWVATGSGAGGGATRRGEAEASGGAAGAGGGRPRRRGGLGFGGGGRGEVACGGGLLRLWWGRHERRGLDRHGRNGPRHRGLHCNRRRRRGCRGLRRDRLRRRGLRRLHD